MTVKQSSLHQELYDSGLVSARMLAGILLLDEEATARYLKGDEAALPYADKARIWFLAGSLNAFVRNLPARESARIRMESLEHRGFTHDMIAQWLGTDTARLHRVLESPEQEPGGLVFDTVEGLSRLSELVESLHDHAQPQEP